MKISIITPVFNGQETIQNCISSVLNQDFIDIEYIIMDAKSTDKTLEIIKSNIDERIKLVSEKDKGSCDALNKGIEISTGEIVCFLCADDFYANNNVISTVIQKFESNKEIDIVYSDIVYVKRENESKIVRYWRSSDFKRGMYKLGWLPPHTSLFIKRKSLLDHGLFNLKYKLAADYDLSYRLFEIHGLKSHYINRILVKMRIGGISNSSVSNIYASLMDCYRVLNDHNVKYPLLYVINTFFYRINQIFLTLRLKNS
jgi:glycosyltransferase